MSVFITFAAALLIFGAVIAIHEFGHFAVAKLCGVQVNEFSIGMGPTLIKTYRKGTQYTLRLLPVGGFVALEGEESPESEQAEGGSGDDDGPDIPPEVLAQRTGKPLNSTSSGAPRATAQTSPSAGTAGSWSCRTSSSTPGRMNRARPT